MLTDLSLLRDFLAFARSTHVTRAAEDLHMSPSTLSTRLRQLERQVGVPLIEPAGRTVRLTGAGEALVEVGRDLLHEVELAEAAIVSSDEVLVGRVRLGCDEWFAITLADLTPAYSKRFPHVSVSVRAGTGSRTHKLLQESEIDLAIVAPERLDPSCCHVPLAATFLRAGVEPIVLMESTSKLVLLQWAREGLGVALVPGAPPIPEQGVPSVTVTCRGEQLSRETVLGWRRGGLSPAVETMKRLILSRIGGVREGAEDELPPPSAVGTRHLAA
jgi:DNA-binding transcriptional LysR family regulator